MGPAGGMARDCPRMSLGVLDTSGQLGHGTCWWYGKGLSQDVPRSPGHLRTTQLRNRLAGKHGIVKDILGYPKKPRSPGKLHVQHSMCWCHASLGMSILHQVYIYEHGQMFQDLPK